MSINELIDELDRERNARIIAEKRISDLEAKLQELTTNNYHRSLLSNELAILSQLSDFFSRINYGFLSVDACGAIVFANDVLCRQFEIDNNITGTKIDELTTKLSFSDPDLFNINASDIVIASKTLSIHNSYFSVIRIPSTKSSISMDVWLFVDITKELDQKKKC